jgi:hypothetical protein
VPTDVVAVAVVIVRLESVAVNTQVPDPVYETAVKVEMPAVAASVVVPLMPHGDVRTIESVEPMPVVTMLLYTSSTAT